MGRILAAALVLAISPPAAAAELTVCRPDALGSVSCPGDGPRPKPRPIYRAPVQALDRVEGRAAARQTPETFVPSRETRRLGGTMMLERGLSGPCRPDALGNLNCR